MKDNKQHRRHKNTAASKLFNTSYVPTISELVITKHGPSYENVTTLGKTWRTNIEYKPEIEEFLISRTRLFIRTLDTRDSNSTNPQFLRSLTNMIADYLSKYTARSSQQLTRKKATQFLTNALYDNFNYIQTIIRMINIKKTPPTKRLVVAVIAFVNTNKQKRIRTKKHLSSRLTVS